MIKKEHTLEAKKIGEDSWELLRFTDLAKNASRAAQVDALKSDRKWLCDHMDEVCHRIDDLIKEIQGY